MGNMTLEIASDTQDLVINSSGELQTISNENTIAQCVRLTLEAFIGQWFLDTNHGTDYDQIIADSESTEAVLSAAIFQETQVQYIDNMTIEKENTKLVVSLSARLKENNTISLEVTI